MDETTHYIITHTVLITVVHMLSSSSVDTRAVMILCIMCHPKIVIYKWVSLQPPAWRRLGELQSDCFSFPSLSGFTNMSQQQKHIPDRPHLQFHIVSSSPHRVSMCCSCSRYRCGSGIRKKSTFRLVKISIVTPQSSDATKYGQFSNFKRENIRGSEMRQSWKQ